LATGSPQQNQNPEAKAAAARVLLAGADLFARHRLKRDPYALGEACGLQLDTWQARVVGTKARRLLVNCGRQTGKSTAVALLMLRGILSWPRSRIACFGPSQDQATVVLDHLKAAIAVAGAKVPEVVRESERQVRFADGSRIQSLPATEKTVRGIPGVRMLVIDEAARVPEQLYRSIRPMIAAMGDDATIVAPSTPFGDVGWWADAWHGRSAGAWEKHINPAAVMEGNQVVASTCPRTSVEFLREEHEDSGDWWFLQEYMCQFMDADTAAFSSRDIAASFRDEVEQWDWLDADE